MEKLQFFTLPGIELKPLGHPAVESRYTDYATAAHQERRKQGVMATLP
jgi:hypothetical protein